MAAEWNNTGGMVPEEIAAAASEECERMLRSGDRVGRGAYDKKKLLLYAIISGSRRHIDRLLRDQPPLFNTIEDFLWFQLSAVRDCPGGSSSFVLSDGLVPYSLDDLQIYLNKFEPSYYTKNGKDLLVYPYILLLSMQLLPAVLYLSKETGDEGYNVDAAHLSIVLADHAVLSEGAGTGQKLGVMDASAEVSTIIRQYGSMYLRLGDLQMALEYYAQSAAAVGGGQLSWTGRGNVDQQRQRNLMLKQLLTELLLRDGGIYLLLGARGAGEEGELGRFVADPKGRQQFLFEAAGQCQEAGMYDKSIEIQKRVGSFSAALDTINKCLSEAICSLFRGRLDGESRTAGLIQSGNEILETYTYYPDVSLQEREHVFEQQTVLRQLESILSVHKLARLGNHVDALREVAKLPFLPLDPRGPDIAVDVFENLSPHVQACIPDLLKVSLTCVENVTDSDGSLRALRAKTTFEDVFPVEATSVEVYLQQVHEMAMVSAVQEAQKDNLKSFNDYMMKVLEEDWQKEKRDFLQSLNRISTLPRTNMIANSNLGTRSGQIVSMASNQQVSSDIPSMDIVPLTSRPIAEKKASVYAEVVKNLNKARQSGLPFKLAEAF